MASARPAQRAGAIALAGLAALIGCDRVSLPGAGPAVLELAADTVQLPDSVTLIEVEVRRSDAGDFDPATIAAGSGDVVRFTAGDAASHALAFDGASVTADVRAFLERTSQLRSPPLITEGATWVLSLADAPPGMYSFRCLTHNATGALTVQR